MKEHPILFSSAMVKAILEGRKTQTRRVVKPQPKFCHELRLDGILITEQIFRDGRLGIKCPYGVPCDRLWVRETWGYFVDGQNIPTANKSPDGRNIAYKERHEDYLAPKGKWKPSIHMPRWASRITLEIVSIRVSRLQEISQADARAEGAPPSHPSVDCVSREFGYPDFPRSYFAQLWDHINEDRGFSWESNPWVWVIEFRRVP